MNNEKTITLLLCNFDGWFGRFVRIASGSRYSHAAIALDGAHNEFYSFTRGGFSVEHPFYRKKRSEMLELRIPVAEVQHAAIKQELEAFISRKDELTYSKLGVFLLFLGIPFTFKNRFFCSQFVALLLAHAGVATLNKHSSLYFPGQLAKLEFTNQPMRVTWARRSLV